MLTSDNPNAAPDARSHPALFDAQTGLANRLHFDLVYDYIFQAGDRGLPFTIMLVSAGADEGTPAKVIRELGEAVERTTRNSDLVSHVGMGRYVVLLVGTNPQGGRIAADRVESAVKGLAPGPVCFSLTAFSESFEDSQDLLRAADAALLAAEAAGGGVELGS